MRSRQRNIIAAAATGPSIQVSSWLIIQDFGYLTFLSDTIIKTHLQSKLQLGLFLVGNAELAVSHRSVVQHFDPTPLEMSSITMLYR